MGVVSIGRESFIGGGGEVEANVVIGHFTSIAGHVQMLARPQHACIADPRLVACGSARIPGWPNSQRQQTITIGSDVWVGRDAVLLADLAIGDGAIVGAFSVVAKDVPPYAIVVGNPARIIRYRYDDLHDPTIIPRLLELRWWEWSEDCIAARAADFRDIDVLLDTWGR